MGPRFATMCGVSLAFCAAAPTVGAQSVGEPPIALAWEAPPDCPKQPQVLDEVHRRLGGQPAAGRGRLRATGHVDRRVDGHYHVHLTTDLGGVAGDKHLDDASCAALAEAAALVIALTFDPEAVAAASAQPRPAPAPPPATPAPATLPPGDGRNATPPATASDTEWGLGVHMAAGAALGVLPGVALGLGGGATLLADRARAELALFFYPTRSGKLEDSDAGGDFQLIAASASGCYAALIAPFEAAPCLGLSLGRVSAEGTNVRQPGEGAGLWLSPFAAVRMFVPVTGPVGIRAELGLEIPLVRDRFVVEDLSGTTSPDTIHRAAAVVGRGAVGAELRF